MTEDVNEQVEAEEMGEEIDLETGGAARRRKRCGFWAVTTLVFVVATAVLAWLYTVQIDELRALRAQADQANSQVVRLQQANRQVKGELNELVDKLREVVKVVDALEEVEGLEPSAEGPAAEAPAEPAVAEPPDAPEPEPVTKAEPAEQQRPRAPRPRVPAVPPSP